MNLIQISDDVARIERELILNGGQITPELEKEMDDLSNQLAVKIDGYDYKMAMLEAKAIVFKMKSDELLKISQGLNKCVDTMRSRIKFAMLNMNVKEIKGERIRFVLSSAKAKLIIDKNAQLPDKYKLISYSEDKDKIRADLESGVQIEGCRLEPSWKLNDYPFGGTNEVCASNYRGDQPHPDK